MKIKTPVKAGGITPGSNGSNHNQTLALSVLDAVKAAVAREGSQKADMLRVVSGMRCGAGYDGSGSKNHNQTLRVRTSLKAGGIIVNY